MHCYIEMPKEESILKYNHGVKSVKIPFIIYADMEFLLEKIDTRHNNPENSSTAKTSTQLLVIYYWNIAYLMPQKTNIIINTEIAWKAFIKI